MDMCRGVPVECSCSCYKAKKPAVVCLSSPLLLVYAHLVVDDVLDPDGPVFDGFGPKHPQVLGQPHGVASGFAKSLVRGRGEMPHASSPRPHAPSRLNSVTNHDDGSDQNGPGRAAAAALHGYVPRSAFFRVPHPNVIPGARRFPRTTRHFSRIIL